MTARDYPRTLRPPSASFFLFGIRGVGKSTWARQRFPHAPRIDLLDEGAFQSFVAVEVKTTANPAQPHLAGLGAIADLAGIKQRVLVHMGERAFNTRKGSRRCQ